MKKFDVFKINGDNDDSMDDLKFVNMYKIDLKKTHHIISAEPSSKLFEKRLIDPALSKVN